MKQLNCLNGLAMMTALSTLAFVPLLFSFDHLAGWQ